MSEVDSTVASAPVTEPAQVVIDGDDNAPTLMTNEAGEAAPVANVEQQTKDVDPLSLVPDAPDGYEISFATNSARLDDNDPVVVNMFKAEAHALGLSKKQAQGMAEMYVKTEEAQMQKLQEAKKGWEADITSRPTFAQDIADARRVLVQYGNQDMIKMMEDTALGSHPVFYDFMVKVGKALAEPNAIGHGEGVQDKRQLAEKLWPNMQ